jgi:putative nucleotidyltransferase with HDIG domain
MNIDEAVAIIEDIPTISTSLAEILRVTSSEKSSVKDLSRIIYSDQAIATKIIKMANSSYYGFTEQVRDIDRAIVILGFDEIRSVAIAMSVFDSIYLKKGGTYYNRLRSWNHALLCGFGAKTLADSCCNKQDLSLFAGGLIHDIGKVFMDRYFLKEFTQILQLVEQEGMSTESAERKILKFDHGVLAGKILEKWKFPPQLINMVSYHHHPERAKVDQERIALIFLADLMCHQLGYSGFVHEPKPNVEDFFDSNTMNLIGNNVLSLTPEKITKCFQKMKGYIIKIEKSPQGSIPI